MGTEEPLQMENKSLDLIFIDGKHDIDWHKSCFGHGYSDTASRCLRCLRIDVCVLVSLDNVLAEVDSVTLPEQLPGYLASGFEAVREKATEKLEQLKRSAAEE